MLYFTTPSTRYTSVGIFRRGVVYAVEKNDTKTLAAIRVLLNGDRKKKIEPVFEKLSEKQAKKRQEDVVTKSLPASATKPEAVNADLHSALRKSLEDLRTAETALLEEQKSVADLEGQLKTEKDKVAELSAQLDAETAKASDTNVGATAIDVSMAAKADDSSKAANASKDAAK